MLLAIETSTRSGSVALVDGSGCHTEVDLQDGADLASAVDGIVGDFGRITGYAISVGPGSFTGLRIGIAFLKGLAFVHRRPAVCVSTLAVIAAALQEAHPEADHYLPVIDTRKKEVFAALFDANGAVDPRLTEAVHPRAALESLRVLPNLVAAGDGVPEWATSDPMCGQPRASVLGRVAWPRYIAGETVDALDVEPVYLQASAAEVALGIRAR